MRDLAHAVEADAVMLQFAVIETAEPEDGRVEVPDVDGVFNGSETVLIRGAVGKSAVNTAAGHPPAEGAAVVVQMTGTAPSHFAAPHDQGLVEQAALFEVSNQASQWPIAGKCQLGDGLAGC